MQKVDPTFIEFMKHCILAGRCVLSLVNGVVCEAIIKFMKKEKTNKNKTKVNRLVLCVIMMCDNIV